MPNKNTQTISPNRSVPREEKIILRQSLWVLVGKLFLLKLVFLILFLIGRNLFLLETVVEESTFAFWITRGGIYFFFQIMDAALLIWLLGRWYTHRYIITPERIIMEKGTFTNHKEMCPFSNLESVKLKRTFSGILFRYGNLVLSAPVLNQEMTFKNVPKARDYLNVIEQYIEEKRDQRNIIPSENI